MPGSPIRRARRPASSVAPDRACVDRERRQECDQVKRPPQHLLPGLVFLVACAAGGADASSVPPLPLPGPYAVACSNVAQDFSRLAPGEDVELYWEGVPRGNGTPRNAADLLSDPANTPVGNGQRAGQFRRLRLVRRARPSLRRGDLPSDDARRPAARLFVAYRPVGAAHAAWRRARRCGPTRRRAIRCCCSRMATAAARCRTTTSTQ